MRPISARYMHAKVVSRYERDQAEKLPVLLTDEEAERFIDTADLSEFDLSGFKPMRLSSRSRTSA